MAELWHEERMLIDGRLREADSGATYHNVNPATEEAIGVVADGGPADMHTAIDAARRAFDETEWATDHIGSVIVSAAFALTTHAGQGCANTTRLLLPRAKYREGIDALVEALKGWPYGDPTDPSMLMGPLIREQQRQRVLGYIHKGVEEGATIAVGGGVPSHLPRGYFVEPTVLTDVDPAATVAQEEIFGPVLAVIPHDGDDHAVAIANNSKYGLSGAVVSASDERARAVAHRIRTGTVNVNGGVFYGADVPFRGYRHSGVGREMGVAGFEEYLEIKSIAERAS